MRALYVLTVFVLLNFATSRCVEAGVMLGESPAVTSQGTISMAANLTPIEQEEQQRVNFHQSESSGLTGSSVSSGQTVAQSATIGGREIPDTQTMFCGVLPLANAVLPPSPVLNGLLKPS